jgi:hypothetical protein
MISFEEKMRKKNEDLSMEVWRDIEWFIENLNVNLDQAIELTKIKVQREMLYDGLDVNQVDYS